MNDFFLDPKTQFLLGAGSGMLSASGPQRLPYGIGPALSQGLNQGMQGALSAEGMRMKQLELAMRMSASRPQVQGFGPGTQLFNPGELAPFYTVPFKPETQETKAPHTRKIRIGNEEVTQEFVVTPETPQGAWREVGRGSAFSDRPMVDLKINTKLGEGLAKKVGDIASEGRAAATGAVDVVNTVQRVGSALQSGNVNLGPGATVLNKVDQVAQMFGVGGESTSERLVNTRNVIRGLAQFTVGARKALKGQGQVSDYEGKLLTKAESGEINDFTIPELKDFLKVTDRIARKSHSEHKRIVGVMGSSKDEAVRGLVPYFDIPDLPALPKDEPAPAVIDFSKLPKRR